MFLLYCMTNSGLAIPSGMDGGKLERESLDGVDLLFAPFSMSPEPESIKAMALAFHKVNDSIFKQQSIIPFRFPTTVADESAVRAFLNKHATEYAAELSRLRDLVQMDVLITEQREQNVPAASGTAYLKHRQAEMHGTRTLLESIMHVPAAREWKQSRRPNTIKLSALVLRGEEGTFREQVASAAEADTRVTGPWPPSAFVNCYPEAE